MLFSNFFSLDRVGWMLILLAILYGIIKQILYFFRLKTTGVVVAFRVDEQEDTYAPIVEFSVAGKIHRFTHPWQSSPPSFQLNQVVKVAYFKTKPQYAIIDQGVLGIWVVPFIFILIGCFLLFMEFVIR
jgi:hypothetical protein